MLEERIEATTTPTEYEKRTYTVSEIQDILGIGRVSAYSLVKIQCVPLGACWGLDQSFQAQL